jgi:hypothetical protein
MAKVNSLPGPTCPLLGIPQWGAMLVVVAIILGFAPAMVFAWAFDLTADGGDRVRVTVRLIDPTRDEQVWSEQYDAPLRDHVAARRYRTRHRGRASVHADGA